MPDDARGANSEESQGPCNPNNPKGNICDRHLIIWDIIIKEGGVVDFGVYAINLEGLYVRVALCYRYRQSPKALERLQ